MGARTGRRALAALVAAALSVGIGGAFVNAARGDSPSPSASPSSPAATPSATPSSPSPTTLATRPPAVVAPAPLPTNAPIAPIAPIPTQPQSAVSDVLPVAPQQADSCTQGNDNDNCGQGGSDGDDGQVTLCHATSSTANPYTQLTVSTSGAASGHEGHTGPVFDPATAGHGGGWGDIIPAFPGYAGMNNSGSGAQILANGCAVPTGPSPSPTATSTPTPTPTRTLAPTPTPTPTPTPKPTLPIRPSAPIATATPKPTSTPRPTSTPSATPSPPIATISPKPTLKPSVRPSAPIATAKPPVTPSSPAATLPATPITPGVPTVPGDPGTNVVRLVVCHATGVASSPYSKVIVRAATEQQLARIIAIGHGQDTGPVFDPTTDATGDSWGDIIPAFGTYPGMNATGAGAEIFANDCVVPVTVGGNPTSWSICHWDASAAPAAYRRLTVTAPTTDALVAALARHAAEVNADGRKDIIPRTRDASANLACPGTPVINPRAGFVGATTTAKAQLCQTAGTVYGLRTEYATVSALGPDATAARTAAVRAARVQLARQLKDLATHDRSAIIAATDGYSGFHWGRDGQSILLNSCVVMKSVANPDLLRPSGVPSGSARPVTGK